MAISSGSNYDFFDHVKKAKMSYSAFDESYKTNLSCKLGKCYPVHSMLHVNGDYTKHNLECVAKCINPPVVSSLNTQKMYFTDWKISLNKLWKQAHIFFSKGGTANTWKDTKALTVPFTVISKWYPGCLCDYLGIQCSGSFNSPMGVNALPLVAYVKIMMYGGFVNRRILQSWLEDVSSEDSLDEHADDYKLILEWLFPQDESDFRIGSPQWEALQSSQFALDWLFLNPWDSYFTDDYFTSAQLTPLYADVPELPVSFDASKLSFTAKELFNTSETYGENTDVHSLGWAVATGSQVVSGEDSAFIGNHEFAHEGFLEQTYGSNGLNGVIAQALNNQISIVGDTGSIRGITQDALRELSISTAILEKMAHTDGTYGEFCRTMFGIVPSDANSMSPSYLGGTFKSITFADVVNTTGTASAEQGQITGKGTGYIENAFMSDFMTDDMSIVMTILRIMPETYYCQGIRKEWTYSTSEDFFLPERAKLGMQPILNKEIFFVPDNVNRDLVFAYTDRLNEMRFRNNEAHGYCIDPTKADFFFTVNPRYFDDLPTLTPSFLSTADNINTDWLSAPDMDAYIVQIGHQITMNRPIPYRSEPADIV